MYSSGGNYERVVYSILDALGDIGGLADAAMFFGYVTSFYFTATFNRVESVERYLEIEGQETRIVRPQKDFNRVFRCKLFCFETVLCLSKCLQERKSRK